jgi:acetate kinase
MLVLVINSGSSTLKFDLVDVSGAGEIQVAKLAHGVVDRIGGEATFEMSGAASAQEQRHSVSAGSHREAIELALEALARSSHGQVQAVGHRVVHGGSRFVEPTLIDGAVIGEIEELCELAPLHNPAALEGIRAVREVLGSDVPMVGVFDTAFHSELPKYAYTYALPYEMAARHKIRRYGFHGTAHEYMLRRYARLVGADPARERLVTLQLGNGCSAAAIRDGRSVDTSMGLTPLEGLVMGTRSGDIDPSIVGYLAEKEGVGLEQVDQWLNKESGLMGISGSASDMRSLLASVERGDKRAELAVEVFCYRVRKYIGAYIAALGGAEAIIFGGGIGENSAHIRARILDGMGWCGIKLDEKLNDATAGKEGRISAADSHVGVYVVRVDESLLIAEDTERVVRSGKASL